MDLPKELLVIHQPVRLKIMGLLYKHRDVSFTTVRNGLGLTDGNLASHAKTLADHDYLEARKVLTREGFEMRYRITREGSKAFRSYLSHLRTFLAGLDEDPEPAHDASGRDNLYRPGEPSSS